MKIKFFLLVMIGLCLGFILFMLISTDFEVSQSNIYFNPIISFSFLLIAFISFYVFSIKIKSNSNSEGR